MATLVKNAELTMGEVHLEHCPMADNNRSADWLSLSDEIQNPYFGSAMLTSGEVKQEIK